MSVGGGRRWLPVVAAAAALVAAAGAGLYLRARARPPAKAAAPAGPVAGVLLTGRVVDRQGRPIAGARLSAESALAAPAAGTASRAAPTVDARVHALSGGDGGYRLRLPAAGLLRLRVEADGFQAEELAAVEAPGDGVEIALARRLGLEGVVRRGGQPAAGVAIDVAGPGGVAHTTSGARGEFALAALAEGHYALRATAAADADAAFLDDVVVSAAAKARLVEVALKPAVALGGRVRDGGGQPIAGAEVTLVEADTPVLPRRASSDAAGAFHFAAVLPGPKLVSARAAGFLPADAVSTRVAARALAVELRLTRGAIIEGHVRDEAGRAVAGAHIEIAGTSADGAPVAVSEVSALDGAGDLAAILGRLDPAGELGVLRGPIPFPPLAPLAAPPSMPVAASAGAGAFVTDGDGAFRVDGLPAGRLVVAAAHPEFARGLSAPAVVAAGATVRVDVVLSRGVTLRGRVVDDRGVPVVGAEVSADDGRAPLATDAHGEFTLTHVARPLELTARKLGFLPASVTAAPDATAALELRLGVAVGALAGDVRDDRGAPVVGARLEVKAPAGEARTTMSDRGGRFRLDGLGPGPYRVVITHNDFARLVLAAVEPDEDARFALTPGGGLDGDVRDARTGAVPAGAQVTLMSAGERRALPLVRGRFSATALPAGEVTLEARAPGYVPWSRSLEVPVSDRLHDVTVRDLRVELERGGALIVEVRDDHGDPAVDAAISAAMGSGRMITTPSDGAGRARLDGLAAGRWHVSATKGELSGADDVEIRAGDESRVDLRLR